MSDMSETNGLADFDMTEEEFDRAFASGTPVVVVNSPVRPWRESISSVVTYTAPIDDIWAREVHGFAANRMSSSAPVAR